MVTTINNSERVFLIYTSVGKTVFCNVKDLDNCLKELEVVEGYYKVYHFWNGKQIKLSKKEVEHFKNLK